MKEILDYSLEELMILASSFPELGRSCSFVQVENGKEVLGQYWSAYQDFCKRYEVKFNSREDVANDFARELNDHVRSFPEYE